MRPLILSSFAALAASCASPATVEPSPPALPLPSDSREICSDTLAIAAARIRTHAHNIANAHTVAFKRSVVQVEDVGYDTVLAPGLTKDAGGTAAPAGLQVGHGAQTVRSVRSHVPGVLKASGRNLDIAIEGNGYFQVLLPDGTLGYTRDGRFMINADGKLVTGAGYLVHPEVCLQQDVVEINFDTEGRVTTRTQNITSVSQIAQLQLAKFINPQGLLATGGSVFKETDASGHPILGNPHTNGLGGLKHGVVECSNVVLAEELLQLREAQREYDILWQILWSGAPGDPAALPPPTPVR